MHVVYYHNVVEGELSEVDRRSSRLGREMFALQMNFLRAHFQVIPLAEHIDRLINGNLDDRCVSVTFDDAYEGVEKLAAPILASLGMSAAVFAISTTLAEPDRLLHYEELEAALALTACVTVEAPELGFDVLRIGADKSRALFLKRVKTALKGVGEKQRGEIQNLLLSRLGVSQNQLTVTGLPRARKMTAEALQNLKASGLWEVGAHTRTHRVLSRLSEGEAREEIFGCRAELAEALGQAPEFLAYPYGKPEHVGSVTAIAQEAGFKAAFSTIGGANDAKTDRFMLKRVEFIDLMAVQPRELQDEARRVFRR